ncbi:MAG: prolyl oligopeptidase family serine peptidase [Sphingomonadales bacterium]|nr:prolyl oligopeptidase family serine peptidase [Sphingomonadales bacterium]
MIAAVLLAAATAGACPIDERMARAERLTPEALAPLTDGVPTQRGYRPGGSGLAPYADVHWIDTQRFWYETKRKGAREIVVVDPLSGGRRVLPVAGSGPVRFDPASGVVVPDAAPSSPAAVSPDGRFSAWVTAHDLWVAAKGARKRQITRDGGPWYSFDPGLARSNPVESDASGAAPRVHWIGTGPWFWIERLDQRRVRDIWLADTLAAEGPTVRRQKMPYPGDSELPRPEIWLANAESGGAHRIAADGWDYLGNMDIGMGGIAPSRDGRQLLFMRLNRGYDRIELAAATVADGRVRTLLREPPGASGVRYPEFAELADGFLWKSDRDGWAHYYRYDRSGRLIRQVTQGAFSVDRIVHVDEARGEMLFTAFADTKGSSGRSQLHRVRLDGSDLRRIDQDDATHIVQASPDGAFIVDTVVRPDAMPKMLLRDREGRQLALLEEADRDAFERQGWRPPIPLDLVAADGRERIEGMMWLPPSLDRAARLPVIVQAYPGPSNDVVPTGFVPAHPNAALAELGFAVVTFGQRGGAPTRGKTYQFFAREPGRMRDYPIADNAAALTQLAQRFPFVDLDRVGIWGRSGGGFMATTAMLQRPDLYKVGVAIAGNHDNNIYEQNSTEFNFGRSPDPYPTNAAIAGQLRGKLLLVHGDMDEDVHVAHSLRLVRSLIDAGKRFDLLILPGEGHSDYRPATERYLRQRTWDYFLQHLLGLPACEGADLGAPTGAAHP